MKRIVSSLLLVSALFIGLNGCQPKEGPAEKAGRKVDGAVKDAADAVEDAADDVGDAAAGRK